MFIYALSICLIHCTYMYLYEYIFEKLNLFIPEPSLNRTRAQHTNSSFFQICTFERGKSTIRIYTLSLIGRCFCSLPIHNIVFVTLCFFFVAVSIRTILAHEQSNVFYVDKYSLVNVLSTLSCVYNKHLKQSLTHHVSCDSSSQ